MYIRINILLLCANESIIIAMSWQRSLLCKASVAKSDSSLLKHKTVAPERSVGVLVVIVEVSGEFDVRLKLYRTLVTGWLAC